MRESTFKVENMVKENMCGQMVHITMEIGLIIKFLAKFKILHI